ncbi:MAG: amidase [Pseudomonadales bacterium]
MWTEDDLVTLDALTLSRSIHRREVSCVEVMRACLARIAHYNREYNAIIALQPENELLAQAADADAELDRGQSRGWLHGIPQAVKDLSEVRGLPFTQGSPLFRDRVSTTDSPAIARIRDAGALFIGKTNTPEFGLGSQTFNPVHGATRNAYDPARTAGGSSGGAAVALALRMLAVADGSDFAGSLRNPAAFNNVFGFRPTIGRVVDEVTEVFHLRMGVSGPMARTVPDLAALLATMAGPDPRSPYAIHEDPRRFLEPLERDLTGMRVGWLGDFNGHLAMEAGVLNLCEQATHVFTELGASVEPVMPRFDMESLFRHWMTLRHWQIGGSLLPAWNDPAMRAQLKPEAAWEVEQGLKVSAFDVTAAAAVRSAWYRETERLFARYDYLLLPAAQVFPFDVQQRWPERIGARVMDTYHRWMEVVIPVTMAAGPALCVPAGFNDAGLPMGLQVWGRWGDDFGVLQVGRAYERATNWVGRRLPPGLDADR